jgi:uncharacterized Zn-binding protein involved in type VI secretion
MAAVVKIGDMCSGHGTCPPRNSITGSDNVFINGVAVHRVGDQWAKHCHHDSILATGSSTVFINGRSIGRVGDMVACGSMVSTGSNNVNVN